jgi:hypothetical protein
VLHNENERMSGPFGNRSHTGDAGSATETLRLEEQSLQRQRDIVTKQMAFYTDMLHVIHKRLMEIMAERTRLGVVPLRAEAQTQTDATHLHGSITAMTLAPITLHQNQAEARSGIAGAFHGNVPSTSQVTSNPPLRRQEHKKGSHVPQQNVGSTVQSKHIASGGHATAVKLSVPAVAVSSIGSLSSQPSGEHLHNPQLRGTQTVIAASGSTGVPSSTHAADTTNRALQQSQSTKRKRNAQVASHNNHPKPGVPANPPLKSHSNVASGSNAEPTGTYRPQTSVHNNANRQHLNVNANIIPVLDNRQSSHWARRNAGRGQHDLTTLANKNHQNPPPLPPMATLYPPQHIHR